MKKRLLYLILPVITLILEILPYGAVCNFANPDGEPWRKTFSYFSLTPFGYANVTPLIVAILTCLIFILLIVYCTTGKHSFAKASRNILFICAILSFGPLTFGIKFFSFWGALITVSLIAEFILIHFSTKNN
jgi:cbb3-type cytochrome oxidase subunit 3